MGAPPLDACCSQGPPSRPRRQTGLQHPRGRLQEQREPHLPQSSAAPLHARPGRYDAAAVPEGEAQPAAESEPLLAPVLLVSAPRLVVTAPSSAAPFGNKCGPSQCCPAPPLHPGKAEHDWARKWGAGVGRGPGDLVAEIQGLRALPLAAPPEPENRKLEGCLRGNHSPEGKCTEHPPLLLQASPELLRNSHF